MSMAFYTRGRLPLRALGRDRPEFTKRSSTFSPRPGFYPEKVLSKGRWSKGRMEKHSQRPHAARSFMETANGDVKPNRQAEFFVDRQNVKSSLRSFFPSSLKG